MATIIDSYSESNFVTDTTITVGQSFTGDGQTLDSAKFYLKREGSPSGNVVAKIYAHSGTFGTSSLPTGAALATSDNVDVSTIGTGSYALVDFPFSGANRITLANGTKYVVVWETSFTFPNYVHIGYDSTSPTHGGNFSFFSGGVWNVENTRDLLFYVYGVSPSSASASLSPSSSPSPSPSATPSPSLSPSPLPDRINGILKIAKEGINVLTNSDPEKFIFSSEYGTLKYYSKQTAQVEFDANTAIAGNTTINHNLGYYPFVEVFVKLSVNGTPVTGNYEYVPFAGAGISIFYDANYKITTSSIVLYGQEIGVSTSVWTFDFLIFIFKNDLGF